MKKEIPNWAIITCFVGVCLFFVLILSNLFNLFNLYDFKYDVDKDGNMIIEKNKFMINKDMNSFYDDETKSFYVEGIFKNNTEKTYYNISLTYTIYDLDGNVLGNAYAYLDRINSSEKWKFKATYLDIDATDAVSYKLIDISYN